MTDGLLDCELALVSDRACSHSGGVTAKGRGNLLLPASMAMCERMVLCIAEFRLRCIMCMAKKAG
jgi:hypothetical protein